MNSMTENRSTCRFSLSFGAGRLRECRRSPPQNAWGENRDKSASPPKIVFPLVDDQTRCGQRHARR